MSRADRRANGYRGPLVEGEPVARVVAHARLLGCTCLPDVWFSGPPRYGEIANVKIAHDNDCELITRGLSASAIVIHPPNDQASP